MYMLEKAIKNNDYTYVKEVYNDSKKHIYFGNILRICAKNNNREIYDNLINDYNEVVYHKLEYETIFGNYMIPNSYLQWNSILYYACNYEKYDIVNELFKLREFYNESWVEDYLSISVKNFSTEDGKKIFTKLIYEFGTKKQIDFFKIIMLNAAMGGNTEVLDSYSYLLKSNQNSRIYYNLIIEGSIKGNQTELAKKYSNEYHSNHNSNIKRDELIGYLELCIEYNNIELLIFFISILNKEGLFIDYYTLIQQAYFTRNTPHETLVYLIYKSPRNYIKPYRTHYLNSCLVSYIYKYVCHDIFMDIVAYYNVDLQTSRKLKYMIPPW